MLRKFNNWMTRRGLPPHLQSMFDTIQADPKMLADFEARVKVQGQSPEEALEDMGKYSQLQSYKSFKGGFNPTGATPKQSYGGDLRTGNYEPRDMTAKVIGRNM